MDDPKTKEAEVVKRPTRFVFGNGLRGKTPMSTVESIDEKSRKVSFRLKDIEGFEGTVEIVVQFTMLDRFEVGAEVELRIKDLSVASKKITSAEISKYPPSKN